MTLIEVDAGVRVNVEVVGSGPVVVLVAGFGMAHEVWDRQVRVLAERRRVVCVDQRGHGGSDRPLGGYSVERLAADLVEALAQLGVEECALVGWSFGGQVAFEAAAGRPDLVSRLVLVGSNAVRASRSAEFPFGPDPERMLRSAVAGERADRLRARRSTIEAGFAAPPDSRLLDWLVGCSMRLPSWAAEACYEAMMTTDLIARLPRVVQPVLQVVGAADPIHSAEGARWLLGRLADSRLVELADCGHYPMFEAAQALDAALTSFLFD